MTNSHDPRQPYAPTHGDQVALRARAEQKAHALAAAEPPRTPLETSALLHELRVHQFELEMQNEEIRRAHLALDVARARYFDLYDLAPVGYVTVDEDGLIVESNARASSIFLTPRAELVGRALTGFVAAGDQDVYYLHRRRVTRAEPVTFELRMRRNNGAGFWARVEMLAAAETRDGAFKVLVTVSDVSEVRHMRDERELSQRIVSVGVMAASVAHEINNPLTYVLYQNDALVEGLPRLSQAVRKCRQTVVDLVGEREGASRVGDAWSELAPSRLDGLVECARQAAHGTRRIEEVSRQLTCLASVDPDGLVHVDVNAAAIQAIKMASLEVRYRAALIDHLGQVPSILASPGRLTQVFLNLLLNAAHAIREGSAQRNRVTLSTWTDADGQACASVEDTGCGIHPEHLSKIFEPFYTTGISGDGMGLGMAITHRIVSAFGGDVSIQSVVGEGTRVDLRFPAAAAAPLAPVERAHVPAVRGRVLVIDDDDRVREAITRVLEEHHEVVAASSGQQAMTLIEEGATFDVILCDLVMPRITGMDFHVWLHANDPDLATRVVFITGGVFAAGARRYLASVANECLTKPYEMAALRELVNRRVSQGRAA